MKQDNHFKTWSFPFRKRYYLKHPIKWVKEAYWNIRNFIHRGKYGYAYTDVWNWFNWWPRVGAEALKYLKEHGSCCPGYTPFETKEKWDNYLNDMAEKLIWCAESCECVNDHEDRNELYQQSEEVRVRSWQQTENGCKFNITPEDQKILDQYWSREYELDEEDTQKRIEIFTELAKNLSRFWD